MHELSIARALLEQVGAIMLERQAAAVSDIALRIGPLSGVEPALLRAAYMQLRDGTAAENATLQMIAAPVRIRCIACCSGAEAACNRLACPRCGSARTELTGGDEMLIESVELVFQTAR